MRTMIFALALFMAAEGSALATWSVIAVDRSTGRVVISSSTCTGTTDDFLKDVQAVVVPGKGVAACQAAVDRTHRNQTLVFNELQKGTDPARIIELLSQDPSFQQKQYGIVDLQGRMAGHSGFGNGFVSQDIHGQVPGTDVFYSIQGNILRTGGVVPKAVKALVEAKGGITDRVMAAMEAADANGGDSRCTCDVPTVPAASKSIPCSLRTSLVAYILVADPNDTNGPLDQPNLHNNGQYALYLPVSQPDHGPTFNIKRGEDLDPVKTLRMRYDAWMKAHPGFKH